MDFYGFYTGTEFQAYRYLGAHREGDQTVFRTFAPGARQIQVIGEFNGWNGTGMNKIHDGNFWECRVGGAKPGQMYKYRITGADNSCRDRCDPYGFRMELRPHSASYIQDEAVFDFGDSQWMKKRTGGKDRPLNIYEIHAGSWRRPSDRPDDWYTYRELGERLIPYLKERGYNYVELLPLAEHPCDESWGYQITGFFSPTSRYGTPEDLKAFIKMCHAHDIGVIMDFVPVHFAVDDYALWKYDGTALYEYPNQDVGKSEWGSCNFMHSRGETRCFLQSAANYWLTEYHADGIRMDAISRMIYWQGEPARGVNNTAVDFIREMNRGLKAMHPSAILAAEDSTSYPGVTKPVSEGGLGFDYKWDMGWMNDTLDYFRTAPEYRSENYHKLTFSMMYYYNDRYLLPLSHDETVHGKATILQKMSGDYEEKFPQARAFYMYMYAHPGKKLNFMGNEIGQLREWDEKKEQDWFLLKYPNHDSFHRFMKELNALYLAHPALSAGDYSPKGFTWLDCHQEARCIYAFERTDGRERIAAVFNFSDKEQEDFALTVPDGKEMTVLLASDRDIYGGVKPYEEKTVVKLKKETALLTLSAYSAVFYQVR